jgi:hypothetical protein
MLVKKAITTVTGHLMFRQYTHICKFSNIYLLYLIYLLTYSTDHSPSWKANRFAASQEIPRILWNPKVHYRIHKCPPHVSILNQLNPVHTPTYYFLKIRLILSSHLRLGLPSGLFPWGFSIKTQYTPHPSLNRATWLAHLIVIDVIMLIITSGIISNKN